MAGLHTLLIANRGEIARRVMRTAHARGLRCVALHTDIDASAPHVREADVAVPVGSYLDIDEIVAAARSVGADAVHPGYGFLSERADFARALEQAGITLVGPSSAVMEQMGRKDAAREIAVQAGVPVVPSYDVEGDPESFSYPVLVKAASGGGGKGMRIVHEAADFADAAAAARREAQSAFGDDTLLVEKYVERGRHIEVQVVGDARGEVRHFFERDCSTQRRHQKVLEEAPAPTLTDAQRAAVTQAGVDLARQVGYRNAGTVEFLLDADTGEFFFLEMNTRLQVEHPVTEETVLVGGERLDLVAVQLDVAVGGSLPPQAEISQHGAAIEARVYAEDSFAGFLPQAGTASHVRWGAAEQGVRVDEALESGQVVSTSYDPMLGKVIGFGADRESARRAALDCLDDTAVLGLTTNAGFLRTLLASEEFREATIDTAWLDHVEVPAPTPDLPRQAAAWAIARGNAGDTGHPFGADGFRLSGDAAPQRIVLDEVVTVDLVGGRVQDRSLRELEVVRDHDGPWSLSIEVDGQPHRAFVLPGRHQVEVVHRGQRFEFRRPDVFGPWAGQTASDGSVVAPMPGTLLAVDVAEGDSVEEGQRLGLLEAMKMELALRAPYAGTVTRAAAGVGDQVALGAVLFEVSPEASAQASAEVSAGE